MQTKPDDKEVLHKVIVALNDWLCQYADDMVGEDAHQEAWERIGRNGGTIAYIGKTRIAVEALLRGDQECVREYLETYNSFNSPTIRGTSDE